MLDGAPSASPSVRGSGCLFVADNVRIAAETGDASRLTTLTTLLHPGSLDRVDIKGWTAPFHAANRGHRECVEVRQELSARFAS